MASCWLLRETEKRSLNTIKKKKKIKMAASRRQPTKIEFKTKLKDNIYLTTQQKLLSNLGVAYFKYT